MQGYSFSEYAVIGCLLIDERCFPVVREILTNAEAFSNSNCKRVYEAICKLADDQKPIDPVTVGHATGMGNEFLVECMNIAPSCDAAGEYAKTVADGFKRRQLRAIGEKLQVGAVSYESVTDQLLTDARAALDELANNEGLRLVKSPGDSLKEFLQFRADVSDGRRQTMKIGFPSLDGVIGGFAQGGLYIVAARPGVGKSALGIAMADMLAKKHRVLYVSLEMTAEELNARRVAAFSNSCCSYTKLMFRPTTEQEDADIVGACAVLSERKLYISAVSHTTVAELGIQARNVAADVVMVDYLGLIAGADRKAGEYERITQVSGDLKRLAKQLNCVVIALCQLNRESATTPGTDKTPRLSQLRSSGAIEQDADGVLLLHRPEYGQRGNGRDAATPEQFFVDVAKNRHGRTGAVELAWYAPVNRFEDRGGTWTAKSWM